MPRTFVAVFLLVAAPGCQPASPVPGGTPQATPVASSLKPSDVKLTAGDEKALEALVAAHNGQVVFVDYWATWCLPCVEFFPHTVEQSRKYKERGLATIAVTFDDAKEEATVREFLAKHVADFENLVSSYDLGPAAFEAFGVNQVPHFRLYDRKGELRHKWDEPPEDAEQKIEELLAEK